MATSTSYYSLRKQRKTEAETEMDVSTPDVSNTDSLVDSSDISGDSVTPNRRTTQPLRNPSSAAGSATSTPARQLALSKASSSKKGVIHLKKGTPKPRPKRVRMLSPEIMEVLPHFDDLGAVVPPSSLGSAKRRPKKLGSASVPLPSPSPQAGTSSLNPNPSNYPDWIRFPSHKRVNLDDMLDLNKLLLTSVGTPAPGAPPQEEVDEEELSKDSTKQQFVLKLKALTNLLTSQQEDSALDAEVEEITRLIDRTYSLSVNNTVTPPLDTHDTPHLSSFSPNKLDTAQHGLHRP